MIANPAPRVKLDEQPPSFTLIVDAVVEESDFVGVVSLAESEDPVGDAVVAAVVVAGLSNFSTASVFVSPHSQVKVLIPSVSYVGSVVTSPSSHL